MRVVLIAIRDPERRRRVARAFTLVELVAVIAIIASLASFAAYGWIRANVRSRGRACGQNLLLIEGWKQQWKLDFPGTALPADSNDASGLRRYAIGGVIPTCPGGGTYSNQTSLTAACSCSLNWGSSSEREEKQGYPSDPDEGADRSKNGFHDPGY